MPRRKRQLVAEAPPPSPPLAPPNGPAPRTSNPKRDFVITGGIVPPGTLPPHPHHPLSLLTPEEREKHAEIALGNLVLALTRANE
jgi:hypothetical protein